MADHQIDEQNYSEFAKNLFDIELNYFTYIDYGLFFLMLLISAFIGVYYGFISKRKQDSPAEYILGNKEMKILPVAASLTASSISGVSLLSLPADVYANGTQYIACFTCLILVLFSSCYLYLPVFYDLQLTSCFAYLERRFDSRVKTTASLVFAFSCILFIPIIIYVPALAFNQVSGINVHIITVVISLLCIFYTTVGGVRAVVWTDTIQIVSMMGAVIATAILGTYTKGGFGGVMEAAERGNRLIFFNMDPSPFVRMSFWTVLFGMSTMFVSLLSTSQVTIQRCLSLPSIRNAKICLVVCCIGVFFVKVASIYVGLLMYAEYEDCDPITLGVVKKLDQILPLYIVKIASKIPGLPGLFVAGVFSAALSTMSSILNSLSATIFEDLIKPNVKQVSEKTSSTIMKLTVLCLGFLELGMVFIVEKLGALMHLSYSLHGLTSGTLLGIFTIGMVSRRVNTKGVVVGSIVSILMVGTILTGAQISMKPPPLPLETKGCYINATDTSESNNLWMEQMEEYEEVPAIFRISFLYYALIGAIVMVAVAYPVSLMTEHPEKFDETLLAPFMRSKEFKEKTMKYTSVENAIKIVES